ncbi:uncharacterized protein LOC132786061 isoform X1 [Drosophila nasuta]|uniref:uncharacterized protein LOC132786061 isoform X1 n=1 Tax=Drosophila nasuta TaxID=42062 RepID=UPI00295E900F|nr:uncharacterized protein LOC132786061 isoform X1 [Drosophila nasuta]
MTDESAAPLPVWLKEELFEDLLKKLFPKYLSIKSFKAVPGLKPGENYSTIMLRLHFEVQLEDNITKEISFMLKTPHDFEMYREILKKNNMFDVERDVFLNVKPELEQMYKDAGLQVRFGATAYEINAPDDYVLLEDLRPAGFQNVDRLEGLDESHVLSVLTKLAQWHAASAARIELKGAYKQHYFAPTYTDSMRPQIEETAETLGKYLFKCLPKYDDYESYSDAVHAIQPKFVDLMYGLNNPDPEDFNALAHGDLWTNNILFQYKEGNPEPNETYFVDLQLPRYCSVAYDLMYFLLASTQFDLKISHFDYFIKNYHGQLKKHLQLLKYPEEKIPTLRSIHQQLLKHGFVGYQVVLMLCPPLLLDRTDDANLNDFVTESDDGEGLKMQMFSNARYRKHVSAILPWMLNRGALQF